LRVVDKDGKPRTVKVEYGSTNQGEGNRFSSQRCACGFVRCSSIWRTPNSCSRSARPADALGAGAAGRQFQPRDRRVRGAVRRDDRPVQTGILCLVHDRRDRMGVDQRGVMGRPFADAAGAGRSPGSNSRPHGNGRTKAGGPGSSEMASVQQTRRANEPDIGENPPGATDPVL
jgi:hypothetical protein